MNHVRLEKLRRELLHRLERRNMKLVGMISLLGMFLDKIGGASAVSEAGEAGKGHEIWR